MNFSFYKKYCYASLPHAGLGNKLFIWAQCVLFAKRNHFDYAVSGWFRFHIRTLFKIILLREKRHEYYLSPFKSDLVDNVFFLVLYFRKGKHINQAQCGDLISSYDGPYVFSQMNFEDYFLVLREHRHLLVTVFGDSLKKKYVPLAEVYEIGIHIRRDDFIALGLDTPLNYFKEVLKGIREYIGFSVRAKVYSDGSKEELLDVLNMPDIVFHEVVNPMNDMIEMSRSKILILSANSTFGMWAAFLSKAIIIRTEKDLLKGFIQPLEDRENTYEGPLDINHRWPDLLKTNMKEFGNKAMVVHNKSSNR